VGKSQTVVQGSSQQTSTPQPTAEERELNRLQLEREKFLDPQIRATQSQGLSLAEALLRGETNLPGFLKTLPAGISPEITSDIVQESLRDITPSFQQSGLLDSGVRASVSARTAGDIRRAAEEFNLGARQNLLNLALSGQAQVQQPILGFSGQLGSRLAGLRSITQTGTFSQSTTSRPDILGPLLQAGAGIGSAAILACWVAAELFGGMWEPKTNHCRAYIHFVGPKWFKRLYDKYSEKVALFISNKPTLKRALRPLFEWFAAKGKEAIDG
jgi:hypothetical protein